MPRLPAHGPEWLDGENLHRSAVLGESQSSPWEPGSGAASIAGSISPVFASRKEVFTFKRWKKFGNSAEDRVRREIPAAAGTPETGERNSRKLARKKRPGFTARLSEPPACSAFDPQPDTPDSTFAARRRRFSARAGSVQQTFPRRTYIRPEPETRNGLSLARNDAFATITRSTFLACPFDSTYKLCADPFDPRLSARFGFEAATGRIHHPRPVIHALLSRSHDATPSPLPFGRFGPPDQSVQRASSQEARLAGHPICLFAPRRAFFRLRFGSVLETPLRPAWLSFRKPWN